MIRAFICGCSGYDLTGEERAFLTETAPFGLILFKRNVASPEQLRRLTDDFRAVVGRPDAPVLVDQEGGRVQRLGPPHWPRYPAAAATATLALRDAEAAATAARLGGRLIARDLHAAGITIDCAPVLDVPVAGSSAVVGDRAFGPDARTIARLGRAFAEGLLAGGVLPVIKHMPGHGRAEVDSHFDLPVVRADRTALAASDFAPFAALRDLPIGMTAHVTYTAIDPDQPATTSRIVIEVIIRGAIGFDGLLLTDDLSMQALQGTLGERAVRARDAGCDILLHCNGKLDEAAAVAKVAAPLQGEGARRAQAALVRLQPPEDFDADSARAQLEGLLGAALTG
jgi:beta-N-acetylhexosaminidase